MLEHPKAQGATEAIILEDEAYAEMGNQQVTQVDIGWLAGFIDGEGYIGISNGGNHPNSKIKTVRVELNVVNTDEAMIQRYVRIIKTLGINPFIKQRKNPKKNGKPYIQVMVHRMAQCYRLLKAVLPFLTGSKQERGTLIFEFLESRLEKAKILPGTSIPYTNREIEIIIECIKLQKRGTSETIRKAELSAYQRQGNKSIEKLCDKAWSILKLHKEGKTQTQIAVSLGHKPNHGSEIGWWIRRLKTNETPIQKLGYFPLYSDDIVRPFAKA